VKKSATFAGLSSRCPRIILIAYTFVLSCFQVYCKLLLCFNIIASYCMRKNRIKIYWSEILFWSIYWDQHDGAIIFDFDTRFWNIRVFLMGRYCYLRKTEWTHTHCMRRLCTWELLVALRAEKGNSSLEIYLLANNRVTVPETNIGTEWNKLWHIFAWSSNVSVLRVMNSIYW
jgi:hypothetical protein